MLLCKIRKPQRSKDLIFYIYTFSLETIIIRISPSSASKHEDLTILHIPDVRWVIVSAIRATEKDVIFEEMNN